MRLILASQSPFRRQLLARLHYPFDIFDPNIDETPMIDESAYTLVSRLSLAKAQAYIQLLCAQSSTPFTVIGSDQVGSLHGCILGKPKNSFVAQQQLTKLSGNTATFYTGLALISKNPSESIQQTVVTTKVKFRSLTKNEINTYIAIEKPFHSCGSFQAEGLGISLTEYIQSDDPTALIGLPLLHLTKLLQNIGVAIPLQSKKNEF